MARKQAKRRKKQKGRPLIATNIRIGRFAAPLIAIGIVLATYQLSLTVLDRKISAIEITGPLQRVTALQIEAAIRDQIDAGFVGADLHGIRKNIVALPWIDQARVARRWPNRLSITVTEQVPAAVWGERGLLNTRGELFVTDARHVPAELPRLSGPNAPAAVVVAARYLSVRERLIPAGLDLTRVQLDERGSWEMTLQNGIEVRLGRKDVSKRTELFLDVVSEIITSRAAEIDHIDMRYGNGFTIGWKTDESATPANATEQSRQEMLAARGLQ